jgi:hypothetical protein
VTTVYGGTSGFVIALIAVLSLPRVSCWWLLWGALLGLFFEVAYKLAGAEALEALGDALMGLADSIADSDFGGGGD